MLKEAKGQAASINSDIEVKTMDVEGSGATALSRFLLERDARLHRDVLESSGAFGVNDLPTSKSLEDILF